MKGKATVQLAPRVAFIAPRFHTNQTEIVRYLIRRGIKVSFVVAGVGQSEVHQDIVPEQLEFVNASLLRRWMRHFDDNPYFNLFRLGLPRWSSLRRLLKKRLDLAIIRTPISAVGLTTAFLLKIWGAKIVFYTQTPLYRKERWAKDGLLNLFAQTIGAAWITPCRGEPTLGTPLKNSYFMPFSAFPHRYVKDWFHDGRVAIIMVGKFLPRKRHDLLLDALALLPDPNAFRVTLVGELSDVTGKDTLEAVAEKIRHLDFEVHIRTNLTFKEVTTLYQMHDLFVLPSQHESASVSNLEAMSYGLPVIVSSCNRTSDYAGDSGWVFRSRSVEDLARVLQDALSNRDDLKRRGALAWDKVQQDFTPERVYRPFFDEFLPSRSEEEAG